MNINKEKNYSIFNYFNRNPETGKKKEFKKENSFAKIKSNKNINIKHSNSEKNNSNNMICNISRTEENNKSTSVNKSRTRNPSINQQASNQKLKLNLNLNLNISNTQDKRLEEIVNNDDASKLENTKIIPVNNVSSLGACINKSPIFRRVEKSFFASSIINL